VVTTASGHQAVFSVVVNGDGAPAASRALDELVVALAAA
jgi:D-alanyl-D-alanine carboxypeptidase